MSNRRTPDKRERDLAEVARLRLQGLTQAEIARQMGTTQQQVSRDLRRIARKWHQESQQSAADLIAVELARLDKVESDCWDAWERSCQPAVKRTEAPGKVIETTTRRDGDPRFLNDVLECIERRCGLLGLDATHGHEHEHGGQDGQQIRVALTDEQRLALLHEMFAGRDRAAAYRRERFGEQPDGNGQAPS
jgi:hypothetical protein